MAIYVLKRKTYSEEDGKNGMSTGKKIALGAGAGLAAGAGLFAAAKGGLMGAKAMRGANNLYGTGGAYLSKHGFTTAGNKMMDSGQKGIREAQEKLSKDILTKKNKLGKVNNYTIEQAGGIDKLSKTSGENVSNIYRRKWDNIAADIKPATTPK